MRIERIDKSLFTDIVGIANSGFVGAEPEILIPTYIAKELKLDEIKEPEAHVKITGDGREVTLMKYRNTVNVYVLTEDRIEGPVLCSALVSPRGRFILLNDKLLGKLKIVLLDFSEGTWCFRDELGRRVRRSL